MGTRGHTPDDLDRLHGQVVADSYAQLLELAEDRGWRRIDGRPDPDDLTYDGLTAAREDSRRLLHPNTGNTFALGAAENRQNYAVGDAGLKYEVVPPPGDAGDPALIADVQRFVDLFGEVNLLPEMELETVRRLDEDGDSLIRLFDDDRGVPLARFIEPERLVPYPVVEGQPRSPGEDWGVRTLADDSDTVLGYNVDPGDGSGPEEVPAAEVVHLALNTTSRCPRGWPTFQPAAPILRKCEVLHVALTTTAVVRAKLSAVRKSKVVTRQKTDDIVAGLLNRTAYSVDTLPDGAFVERWPFGAMIRIPDGDSIEFPTAALGAADFETAIQIGLRAAAVRTVMPEWMFTGMASEKYANAFVAEGPSLRAMKRLQKTLVRGFGEGRLGGWASLVWRAVRLAVTAGVLPRAALTRCRIKCTAPSLEVRDKQAEAAIDGQYVGLGVCSREYVRTIRNIPQDEAAKVDEEIKKFGQAGKVTYGPDGLPTAPQPNVGVPTPAPSDGGSATPATPPPDGVLADALRWTAEAARWGGTADDFDLPDGFDLLTADGLAEWVADARDVSKLVKKTVTNKLGRKQTVYVRPGAGEPAAPARPARQRPERETIQSASRKLEAAGVGRIVGTAGYHLKARSARYKVKTPDGRTVVMSAAEIKSATAGPPAGPKADAPPGGPRPTARRDTDAYKAAENSVRGALAAPGKITRQQVADLGDHLLTLDRAHLRELTDRAGLAAGRSRSDAADRLLAHVRAGHAGGEGLARGAARPPKARIESSDEADGAVVATLGRDVSDGDLAAAGGAVDGSRLSVRRHAGGFELATEAPGVRTVRRIARDGRGQLVAENDFFKLTRQQLAPENAHLTGSDVFAEQVKGMRAMGVVKMKTFAAGDKATADQGGYNGYYTWPRLGYDGPIPRKLAGSMPADLRAGMGGSTRLLDLFAQPGGPEWWKANGKGVSLSFDLRDGSRNMRALEAYLATRRDQKEAGQ